MTLGSRDVHGAWQVAHSGDSGGWLSHRASSMTWETIFPPGMDLDLLFLTTVLLPQTTIPEVAVLRVALDEEPRFHGERMVRAELSPAACRDPAAADGASLGSSPAQGELRRRPASRPHRGRPRAQSVFRMAFPIRRSQRHLVVTLRGCITPSGTQG